MGGVVVDPSILHSSMMLRASLRLVKRCSLRHSSRKRPLKLSTKPFCVGLPGAMYCHSTSCPCCQVRIALTAARNWCSIASCWHARPAPARWAGRLWSRGAAAGRQEGDHQPASGTGGSISILRTATPNRRLSPGTVSSLLTSSSRSTVGPADKIPVGSSAS